MMSGHPLPSKSQAGMPAHARAQLLHVQCRGGQQQADQHAEVGMVTPPADGRPGAPRRPSVRAFARSPLAHTVTTMVTAIGAEG